MKIILLQVGNMRNVAPNDGNPVLDFLMQFPFFSTLFFIIATLVFLFFIFSFFGSVVPEMFGKKDVFDYIKTKKSKKVEAEKQIQIKNEEKITKERQEFRERRNRLNSRAETEVLLKGYTKEKWLAKLERDFQKSPYSEIEDRLKDTLRELMKDGYIAHNKNIYDNYIRYNQGDLFDL